MENAGQIGESDAVRSNFKLAVVHREGKDSTSGLKRYKRTKKIVHGKVENDNTMRLSIARLARHAWVRGLQASIQLVQKFCEVVKVPMGGGWHVFKAHSCHHQTCKTTSSTIATIDPENAVLGFYEEET